jgi:hypothetical protein
MNEFTSMEHAAALELQAKAATLVCTYAEPRDAAAARLAVLMLAAEQEAREQGYVTKVGFLHQENQE